MKKCFPSSLFLSTAFLRWASLRSGTSFQHSDADLIILLHVDHNLLEKIIQVQPAFLVKELTLLIKP